MRIAHDKTKTYGCDDCQYLKRKRCQLWEVKVDNPHNSHCESHTISKGMENMTAAEGRQIIREILAEAAKITS